jgi:ABC-type multidrug transport system permease subunit
LTLARFRLFLRDPGAVFWTFGFPILLSLALGIAFRNRPPEPVLVAVIQGPGADPIREQLARSDAVAFKVLPREQAHQELRVGRVAIVVEAATPLVYHFDPDRPDSRLARLLVDDLLQRAAGRQDSLAAADRIEQEPGSRYIDFLLPGLIGLNIMSAGMWGIGYVIVETRTRKLLKRMVATPMNRGHFLLSFVLMRLMFLVVELPLLVGFGCLAFSVPVRGSLLLLVGLAILGALAFSGIGLLVASRARNTQTVGGLINLVMIPMFIGSGVFFSAANFPDLVQPLIQLLPLTALNDAMRAVMNEGAGLAQVGLEALNLGLYAVASFALALKIFRWN